MKERRRMDAVDAALDAAREDARRARLSPALRARILAATRPAAPAPRGRVIDFVLRAAAVAAAFAAVLLVAPVSLEAAEFDAKPLVELNDRLTDTVARGLPDLDAVRVDAPDVSAGGAWTLALAGAALVGAGLLAARRGSRR